MVDPNSWNLMAGDCKLHAKSSFTIGEGEFAEVYANCISGNEKIVILKIIRPPECSGMDAVGFIPAANCESRMELTSNNGYHVRIGDWGEYLVSRMTSPDGETIRTLDANVIVTKHAMTKGMPPIQNRFC